MDPAFPFAHFCHFLTTLALVYNKLFSKGPTGQYGGRDLVRTGKSLYPAELCDWSKLLSIDC